MNDKLVIFKKDLGKLMGMLRLFESKPQAFKLIELYITPRNTNLAMRDYDVEGIEAFIKISDITYEKSSDDLISILRTHSEWLDIFENGSELITLEDK